MARPFRLIALCGSVLASLWLAHASLGGNKSDLDFDGVCPGDNCETVPNGPASGTGSCVAQEDADQDGYGNACDTDTNNDGATGLDDVSATLTDIQSGTNDPVFDFNCDGATGLDDVSRALTDVRLGAVPGPSMLECAGTVPCP